MIVVADSSPLHYLVLLEVDQLLEQLYGRVIVPTVVMSELSHAAAPAAVREWVRRPPSWIQVTETPASVELITTELDPGERAAIAVAISLSADLLLIDEALGRLEARRRQLRVTGTLGVLRAGAEKGLVDVARTVARLKSTNFYIEDELLETVFRPWLNAPER